MRTKLIILFLFIGSLVIAQNSPTLDTITFKRGGVLYHLIIGKSSITINGTTFAYSNTSWTRTSPNFVSPTTRSDKIKNPGIWYMNYHSVPYKYAAVWWNPADSAFYCKDAGGSTDSPSLVVGADTSNGWKITSDLLGLKIQKGSADIWTTQVMVDPSGNLKTAGGSVYAIRDSIPFNKVIHRIKLRTSNDTVTLTTSTPTEKFDATGWNVKADRFVGQYLEFDHTRKQFVQVHPSYVKMYLDNNVDGAEQIVLGTGNDFGVQLGTSRDGFKVGREIGGFGDTVLYMRADGGHQMGIGTDGTYLYPLRTLVSQTLRVTTMPDITSTLPDSIVGVAGDGLLGTFKADIAGWNTAHANSPQGAGTSGYVWKYISGAWRAWKDSTGSIIANGDTTGQLMYWNGSAWVKSIAAYYKYLQSTKTISTAAGFKYLWGSGTYLTDYGESLYTNYSLLVGGNYQMWNKTYDAAIDWAVPDMSGTQTKMNLQNIGTISATTVTANLTGNVTGNTSGSSGSCTGLSNLVNYLQVKAADSNKTAAGNYVTRKRLDSIANIKVTVATSALAGSGIWTSVTGTRTGVNTFTFTGTAADTAIIKHSLFTCTNANGNWRKMGYVKYATLASTTVTVTVVCDSALVSGATNFKVAINRKITDYQRFITIPGEQIADATASQGMFYANVMCTLLLLPVNVTLGTAASGTGAALTFQIYHNTTSMMSSAPDMTTNTILSDQAPATTTNQIPKGEKLSLRIMSSAGATNKGADFQCQLFCVPLSIYTAF